MSLPTPNSSASDAQSNSYIDRSRAAYYAAMTLLIAGIGNIIISFVLGFQTGLWQHYLRAGLVIVFVIVVIINLATIKRGNYTRGTQYILIALVITLTSTAALFSNFGSSFALIQALIILYIAVTVFQAKKLQQALIIGGIASIIPYTFDLFELPYRIPITQSFSSVFIGIAMLVGLVFIYFSWKNFKHFPISIKLVINLIGSAFLTSLLLSSFFLNRNATLLRQQITEKQSTQVESGLALIEEALSDVQKDILFLSQSTILEEMLLASAQESLLRGKLEKDFLLFATLHPNYAQIRFLDAQGQEIIRVDNDKFSVLSSITPEKNLQNKSDRYYFIESIGLSKGDIYISPLDLNVEQGEIEVPHTPMLRFATPVIFNGVTYGEILINLRAENFLTLLGNQENNAFLVDLDGYYLYHQDEAKRWGRDLETEFNVSDDFSGLEDALSNNTLQAFEADGQFFALSPVRIFEEIEPRWYLVNYINSTSAFSPVTQARDIGIGISILILMLMAFAAKLVSRVIADPIINLTEVAQAFAAGDLTATAKSTESNDEVSVLTNSFNAMTSQLRVAMGDLDRRAEMLRVRSTYLQAAAEVGHATASIRDIDKLLHQITRLISQKFGYYHIAIYLLDETNKYATLKASNSSGGADMLTRGHTIDIDQQSIVGYAINTHSPHIALNVEEDTTYRNNPDLPDTRSEIALPLRIGEQVLGALDIQSMDEKAFNTEDVATLEVLANQISIAVENARLLSESQEALIAVRNAYGELSQKAWQELLQEKGDLGFQYHPNKDQSPQAITESFSMTTTSETKEEEGALLVPVKIRDKVIAMLNFNKQDPEEVWDLNEIKTLETMAEQLGVALESARIFSQAQQQAARERVIGETSVRIRETLDIETVLATAADELRNLLDAAEADIWISPEKGV